MSLNDLVDLISVFSFEIFLKYPTSYIKSIFLLIGIYAFDLFFLYWLFLNVCDRELLILCVIFMGVVFIELVIFHF